MFFFLPGILIFFVCFYFVIWFTECTTFDLHSLYTNIPPGRKWNAVACSFCNTCLPPGYVFFPYINSVASMLVQRARNVSIPPTPPTQPPCYVPSMLVEHETCAPTRAVFDPVAQMCTLHILFYNQDQDVYVYVINSSLSYFGLSFFVPWANTLDTRDSNHIPKDPCIEYICLYLVDFTLTQHGSYDYPSWVFNVRFPKDITIGASGSNEKKPGSLGCKRGLYSYTTLCYSVYYISLIGIPMKQPRFHGK